MSHPLLLSSSTVPCLLLGTVPPPLLSHLTFPSAATVTSSCRHHLPGFIEAYCWRQNICSNQEIVNSQLPWDRRVIFCFAKFLFDFLTLTLTAQLPGNWLKPFTEMIGRNYFWDGVKRGHRIRLTTRPPFVWRLSRGFERFRKNFNLYSLFILYVRYRLCIAWVIHQ
jgi:hypothetical protein